MIIASNLSIDTSVKHQNCITLSSKLRLLLTNMHFMDKHKQLLLNSSILTYFKYYLRFVKVVHLNELQLSYWEEVPQEQTI